MSPSQPDYSPAPPPPHAATACPPTSAEVPLAPGFRFHPTDEELVSYYLRRKTLNRPLRTDAIAEVDLYRLEPWDLPSLSRIRSRDAQWYFFARLDRKVAGAGAGGRGGPGNRTNRATPRGYWKTTGKDREVYHRGRAVGMKKTLVFHAGRAPKGDRTNWVMHEYRMLDNDGPQDLHVVCRIFQKLGSGPQNGAQYGAPYMEEEWEDEDDAVENTPTSGTSTEMAAITDASSAESNAEDDNVLFSEINELVQTQGVLNPPELAPQQAQGSNETGEGSCGDVAFSLEEILQEPLPNVSSENVAVSEEQNAVDDHFSLADLSGCASQDDGYAGQDGLWGGDSSNGAQANWPLRTYGNQNQPNGALVAEEFFDTGNDTNAYSGEQQACPSDDQNLYLQSNGLPGSQQVDDDNMAFYDASNNHQWEDGKDDYLDLNGLIYPPIENNESIFDVGDDDLAAYFNAPVDDFKFDSQLPDMSNFAQTDEMDGFTFDEFSKTSNAKAEYGASSSASRENLYPGVPMEDEGTNGFGKRFANMLNSYPAPPAMASEFPPATGKSVAALSEPNSMIRVTAGFVQVGGLSVTDSSDRWPLPKNVDFRLLLSLTVESRVSTKSIGYDEEEPAARMMTVPSVLRGGLYLFFVSAMILMLSFKVGSCIYSR